MTPSANASSDATKSSGLHPLQRLLSYGRAYRCDVGMAIAFSALNTLMDLTPPVLMGMAIDVLVNQQNSTIARWGIQDVLHQFITLSFLTITIWLLESASQFGYDTLWRNLAQRIQHQLRLDATNIYRNWNLHIFKNAVQVA